MIKKQLLEDGATSRATSFEASTVAGQTYPFHSFRSIGTTVVGYDRTCRFTPQPLYRGTCCMYWCGCEK